MSNPKTLTPGLGIPVMDWVQGLPTERSMDYPCEPPPK